MSEVNVVEAIDQWIDARIDEFSDDELDGVLRVLDVIAAHELAEFNTYHLRDDEFDQLVAEFDTVDQQLLADEMITGGLLVTDRVRRPDRSSASLFGDETQPAETQPAETQPAETQLDEPQFDPRPTAAEQTTISATPALTPPTGDELAPRFLGSAAVPTGDVRSSNPTRIVAVLTLAVAIAAFAFGAWSMFTSLDVKPPEISQELTTARSADGTADSDTAEPDAADTNSTAPDAAEADVFEAEAEPAAAETEAEPAAPSSPQADPAAEQQPVTRAAPTAFVLDDQGKVHGSPQASAGAAATTTVYDPDTAGLAAAERLLPWGDQLAFVTEKGGVRIASDPAAATSTLIWDTNNFTPAIDAARMAEANVILTADGTVVSFVGNESPNVDEPVVLWDESPATALSTNGDALLVVLEAGDVMLWQALDSEPQRVWAAEGLPRATAVNLTDTAAFVGLDGGIVQRHRLDPLDTEGERLWQGSASAEPWALDFSASGDQAAIVLDNYQVVVLDDANSISVAWDGSEGLPAPVSAALSGDDLVVLLDTGSVVQMSLTDPDSTRSIWDVSEADVSPAVQPVLVAGGENR